jgi:hypothetical protein
MAYKCIEKKWDKYSECYVDKFICDSESDIADLPKCNPGSMAMVAIEGSPVYVVNASGEWVVI